MSDDAFSKHEVLSLADMLAQIVDTALLGHPSVQANPRWKSLAEKASDALSALYQQVGADTL
jgi:hypothetical protein